MAAVSGRQRCGGAAAVFALGERLVCLRRLFSGAGDDPGGTKRVLVRFHFCRNEQARVPWRLSRGGTQLSQQHVSRRLAAQPAGKKAGRGYTLVLDAVCENREPESSRP